MLALGQLRQRPGEISVICVERSVDLCLILLRRNGAQPILQQRALGGVDDCLQRQPGMLASLVLSLEFPLFFRLNFVPTVILNQGGEIFLYASENERSPAALELTDTGVRPSDTASQREK